MKFVQFLKLSVIYKETSRGPLLQFVELSFIVQCALNNNKTYSVYALACSRLWKPNHAISVHLVFNVQS